jgi:hypothetical protein
MQLNARIKHKRDTASNWATKNPTPLDGEIIIVETADSSTRLKVGDGSTKYSSLPFVDEALATQISANTSNITTLTNTKVTGVTSATDGNVVVFDGTGGRLIKDSGKTLDSYLPLAGATMTGNITFSDGKGLKWVTKSSKSPFVGYCTSSTDGTFVIGSLTGTTYQTGLAIGGASGNLLWQGNAVLTTASAISASKVSGTVASADKANKDASGNVITTTYATKTEVASLSGERKTFAVSDWVDNNNGTYTLTVQDVKSVVGVYKLVGDDYVQVGAVDIALDGQSDVATIRSFEPFAGVLDCAGVTSGVGQPYALTDTDKSEIISRITNSLAGRRLAFTASNWVAVTGGYEYTVPTNDAVVAVYRLDSNTYTLVDTVDIKVSTSTGKTKLFSAVAFAGCVQIAPVTVSVQTPYVLTESDKDEIVTRCNTYTKAEIDALLSQYLTKEQYQSELADAIAVLES